LGLPRAIIKSHQEKSGRGHELGKLPKILEFAFNIFATTEASDFKFGMQFALTKSHHKITPREKVAQNLGFPFNISATNERSDFKIGRLVGFVKAHHKIPLRTKLAWLWAGELHKMLGFPLIFLQRLKLATSNWYAAWVCQGPS